jgi:integrase
MRMTFRAVLQPEPFDKLRTLPCTGLLLGVPDRAVMGITGWSNSAMAAKYQHITAAIRHDIADRVDGLLLLLLWAAEDSATDDRE